MYTLSQLAGPLAKYEMGLLADWFEMAIAELPSQHPEDL
jgi:hypothetical protein